MVQLHKPEMESSEVKDQLTESMWAEPEQHVKLHNEDGKESRNRKVAYTGRVCLC